MSFPVLTFNASTGSDTLASGAGPATAVTGTAAAHTGGVASTTITLTNSPDLSGVSAAGTAVLWLATASGTQFSRITAVDNVGKTVTVEVSFTIAAASAVNYAIGGKRNSFDPTSSRKLLADAKPGWTVQTETAQSISGEWNWTGGGDAVSGPVTIQGAGGRQTITQTGAGFDVIKLSNGGYVLRNLELVNSNATKGTAAALNNVSGLNTVVSCKLGGATSAKQTNNGLLSSGAATLVDCEVCYAVSDGVKHSGGNLTVIASDVHDNGGKGVNATMGTGALTLRDNLIVNNASGGILKSGGTSATLNHTITGNTIDNNTGVGADFSTTAQDSNGLIFYNNIISNQQGGSFAFAGHALTDALKGLVDFNNYYNNAGNDRQNLTAGAHDLALNPGYTAAGTGNYAVGTAMKAVGFPGAGAATVGDGGSSTVSYVDIGAALRQEPAGGAGGGMFLPTSMTGGYSG